MFDVQRFLPDKSSINAVERRSGAKRKEPLGRNCRGTLLTQLTDRFFG